MTKLQALDDCLTPEWLRSLMLDGDIAVGAREVTKAVEADPKECLKLLQVHCRHIIMWVVAKVVYSLHASYMYSCPLAEVVYTILDVLIMPPLESTTDRVQKQAIERAIKKAWDTWVDGATYYEISTHDKYKIQLQEATMPDGSDDENNLVIDYED